MFSFDLIVTLLLFFANTSLIYYWIFHYKSTRLDLTDVDGFKPGNMNRRVVSHLKFRLFFIRFEEKAQPPAIRSHRRLCEDRTPPEIMEYQNKLVLAPMVRVVSPHKL